MKRNIGVVEEIEALTPKGNNVSAPEENSYSNRQTRRIQSR